MLYPTARMKVAVRELYTHLLRFFIRAHDWYQESPWRHALHAITRPVELRYTDLLDKIAECSQAIDQLAISGSQAEVRVMHRKLDALLSVPRKIDIIMSKLNHFGADIQEIQAYQSVHSSALVDTNQRLSDLQISQILTFVSTVPLADPIKSFQYCLSMRNRHQPNSQRGRSNAIWLSPKLRAWSHSRDSDLIIVKGTFQSRFVLRNFCVDVIRQLRASNVPVLWAMRTTHEKDHSSPGPVSSIDLLKYMVLQALRLSPTTEQQQQTEKSMALNCTRFQSATTEQEWLQLLESVLIGINRPVYLILDMQLLDSDLCLPSYFHWPAAWLNLFQALAGRGLQTKVKVLLYGYGSASHLQTSDERIGHIVLRPNHTLRASVRNARNRNKARIRGRIFEVP
ncbi:hypothetical protein AJ80_08969 [Polytolypa hystricis UAMH7299]|uniref:DUF7708 domain-containing protein n=1 Tax=Polytolypa hystricis (strain UAMH7299) TaxID=1447883 RepID=A0A2B7WZ83_POLH7|nr:hypothetical protein AJ80_08969 [Polytolypa hystricis UAMH7299]